MQEGPLTWHSIPLPEDADRNTFRTATHCNCVYTKY